MKRSLIAGVLLTTAMAIVQPALAQTSNTQADNDGETGTNNNEIIVTAQKRAENIVDVPISMAVVGEDQLLRQQVNTLQDLGRTNPQLIVNQGGEGSPGGGAVIRGVGTNSFSRSASGSVGVVIDGVPTGNVNIRNLFDVARVEVLAGPQGTLFGDSVSAGLINIVTNKPIIGEVSGRFSADIAPRFERFSQETLRGVINVPLGDIAAMRVSGYTNHVKGPVYNTFTKQWGGTSEYGGRIRLLVQPSDGLTVNLTADYNNNEPKESFFTVISSTNSDLNSYLATCGIVVSINNFDRCGSLPTISHNENYGFSGQIDLDVGEHTLTSITSYRRATLSNGFADVDGIPFSTTPGAPGNITQLIGSTDVASGPENRKQSLVTQEVRLTSPKSDTFDYVLGAFYQNYDSHHKQLGATTPTTPVFVPLRQILGDQSTDTNKEDFAIFGQSTYHISDTTRAIIGARVNWSSIDDTYRQANVTLLKAGGQTSTPFKNVVKDNVSDFSWKLGLQQEVGPDANLYATVTRGYKNPQAANTAAPITDASGRVTNVYLVRPERPLYFELGAKAGLLQNLLVVTADVYYAKIRDFQDSFCPPPDGTGVVPACASANVTGIVTKGFDLLLTGNPTPELTLNAGVTLADARYPSSYLVALANGTRVEVGGRQLPFAPKWRMTLSMNYTKHLNDSIEGLFGADLDWQSRTGLNAQNLPDGFIPARALLGARLGVRFDERYSLTLYGRNLTNQRNPFAVQNIVFANSTSAYYGANSVRAMGVQFDASF